MVEEATLAGLVQALVDGLRPEKIVLFGSMARGQAGPDSDIDLFIEMEAGADVREAAKKAYAVIGPLYGELKRGVDIVVKDRAFVERYGDLVGSVVRSVRRDGKVLYERS